jgi:hypothetical protein
MVTHSSNPSTQRTEAGASLDYLVSKTKKRKKTNKQKLKEM